jgi:hypothetical protein
LHKPSSQISLALEPEPEESEESQAAKPTPHAKVTARNIAKESMLDFRDFFMVFPFIDVIAGTVKMASVGLRHRLYILRLYDIGGDSAWSAF